MDGNFKKQLRFKAQLIFKALSVRRTRLAAAVLSIMVGAAVVSALANLYLDISIKMSEELRAYGANFYIGPDRASGYKSLTDNQAQEILEALAQEKLAGATPYLYGVVPLDSTDAVLVGVNFSGLKKMSPYWQMDGRWINADFDDRNALVGKVLAEKLDVKVGSTLRINAPDQGVYKLRIKGIMETGGAEDEQIFVSMGLAREILKAPHRVDIVMASIVTEGAQATKFAKGLSEKFTGIQARPVRKIAQSDGKILDIIKGFMAVVVVVITIITSLCVNAVLTAMVSERAKEIGLQKAIGADNSSIIAQFISETILICLVGVILGLVLGFFLAQLMGISVFNSTVTFRPIVIPGSMALSLFAGIVAAIVPIKKALRVLPARVLKGE
ncbi:ABC transporter permease [Polycladidibacter stylochi]|uniref:ABC transporter permease n=1 Tax=Polycladidibacter stylochi TaxID=1807766 RepID=UPI000829F0A0|nr:FtsX-like permease family protein [Pseudovibrio stylochi]